MSNLIMLSIYICIRNYFHIFFFKKILGVSKTIRVFESPLPCNGKFECSFHIFRGPCISALFSLGWEVRYLSILIALLCPAEAHGGLHGYGTFFWPTERHLGSNWCDRLLVVKFIDSEQAKKLWRNLQTLTSEPSFLPFFWQIAF